ncbi:protein of unknown function [Vibrio tapetis subsp. tapetis]|uniref:ChrR-like cupin domain-containing protein n=1 Tax=Vibrio tapetis subsp. tapetis TaxID=1671868 RepID=A0A2N8ZKC7_9VIBR|nr:protein of unknown function [Vibrio tapetis subsp. tapetis]
MSNHCLISISTHGTRKTEHVTLLKSPKDKVFQPHSHLGGEEVLSLSGTFQDEHVHSPWLSIFSRQRLKK